VNKSPNDTEWEWEGEGGGTSSHDWVLRRVVEYAKEKTAESFTE